MQLTFSMLVSLLAEIPIYLVWLIGILIAIRSLSRYPRPAALALIGLLIVMIVSIGSSVLNTSLPLFFHARLGMAFARTGTFLFVLRLIEAMLEAVGWALVVGAIFTGRRAAGKEEATPTA